MLYAMDVGNEALTGAGKAAEFLHGQKIRGKQQEFALDLFKGTLGNLDAVDAAIVRHLAKGWEPERLGRVERAVLRLGIYELLFTETDRPVIINEALEIAKELADEKSPPLINGMLDAVKKEKADGTLPGA